MRLEHWQYDTFVTRFEDKTIEPAYVTFGLDADGKVERVTMKPVSPLADFSYDYQDLLFTPVQEAVTHSRYLPSTRPSSFSWSWQAKHCCGVGDAASSVLLSFTKRWNPQPPVAA